jgi:hypothetical protein
MEVPWRNATTKSRAAGFDATTRPRSSVSAIGSGSDRANAWKASGVMSPTVGGVVPEDGDHPRPPSFVTVSAAPGVAAGAAGGGT